jgi:GNAT superfamily N-acetyltransferase
MGDYRVRPATLDDAEVLVHHRLAMFTDMGVPLDAALLARAFRAWLLKTMADGAYRAWVVEAADRAIVAGAGITIIPWPPGPRYPGDRLAFVYNVYTEPPHRHHGVARLVMTTIHTWCRANGVLSIALNASESGRAMYEAIGYHVSPNPMMFLGLDA